MYRPNKILSSFAGLIGFSEDYNIEIPEIDADLQESRSGRHVNKLHELLTYENLLLSAQQFKNVTVRDWDAEKNYKANDVIKHTDKLWRALRPNVDVTPGADGSGNDWAVTNLFSTYLRNKYNQSVLDLVESIFVEKKLNEQAKQLLTSKPLYVGHGYVGNTIAKNGSFRGIKLTIKNADTVTLLRYIGLQLTEAQNDVPVYLYHSSRSTAIKIFHLNHGPQLTYQWHKITEEILAHSDLETSNPGGAYYIGFYDDDLTGLAIEKQVDFVGKYPCGSCGDSAANFNLLQEWSQLIHVQPFHVPASALNEDQKLWSQKSMVFSDLLSPGINLQFAVNCDLTQAIIDNENVFASALAQQLKVDFLKAFTFSLRNNSSNEKIAQLAASALGDEETPGEIVELRRAKKAVSIDLNGLSPICSKCAGKRVKQRSVWG